MGVDIHEKRRKAGQSDPNPARKAIKPQGVIGSWKGGQSRGKAIGDWYRERSAERLRKGIQRSVIDGTA